MKLWPFKVVCGPDNKPVVVVEEEGKEKQYQAEQVSAILLEKMKSIAETYCVHRLRSKTA